MKKIRNIIGIFILPFVFFLIFYILAPGFGFHTVPIIISQSMIPITMGLAMASIMVAGLMDFSPGARVVLGAIVAGIGAEYFGMPGLIIGAFVGAMFGGIFMAVLYRYLRVPSMVISLGLVLIMEASTDKIAMFFAGSSLVKVSSEISAIGSYPMNIIWTVVSCFGLYYLIYKTKLGSLIIATGNDESMLKNMGIKVDSVKFKAFVISGLFCFVAAIEQISYAGTVQAITNMGTMNMVFKPMMGVLIGLQLIKLVNNLPLMIIIGEIVIQIIFNGFIALGLTGSVQNIILGGVLLIIMGISENADALMEYRRKRTVRKYYKDKNLPYKERAY